MGKRTNGEGSIYQRDDGRWCGSLYIETESGIKRKYFYAKTAKDVMKKIQELKKQVEGGYSFKSEKTTLSQWMRIYLEKYKKNVLKPSTFDSYMTNFKAHILKDSIGRIELNKLSTTHLQLYYNRKFEDLSARTVKYISIIIGAALEQALREGYIMKNPNKAVILPKQTRQEIKPFSPEEIMRLLETAKEDSIENMLTLAVHTGMREGEILGLTWEDINFGTQEITIRNNLCRVSDEKRTTPDTTYYHYILLEPKSKESMRILPMNKTVIQTLQAQKNQQEKLQESTNNEKFNSWGLVFTDEEGNYYHPRRLREHFFKVLHKAGLPKRRFHDLRHTFGTLLISSGNDIRTVQVLLGHADIATSTIYAHITRDKRRESVNDVEKLISNCIL